MHATAANTNSVNCAECNAYRSGGVVNGTCSFDPPSTAVELTSFVAVGRDDEISVEWLTATEINNAGFNLYRATNEEAAWAKINTRMIPARGDALQGTSYSFADTEVIPGITYYYWLEDVDLKGGSRRHGPVSATLGHDRNTGLIPAVFSLGENHPNPFRVATEIRYGLPVEADVNLSVFNVMGQRVATVVDGTQSAGYKIVVWDGSSQSGVRSPDGIYFCRLQARDFVEIRKMILAR